MGDRFPLFIAGAGTLVALGHGLVRTRRRKEVPSQPLQTRTFHAQLNGYSGGAVRLEHGHR